MKFIAGSVFFNIGIILMTVVMESNVFSIVVINVRSSDKVMVNIFDNYFWVTLVWLCIDIESMFIVFVIQGLSLFKGRTNNLLHLIKKNGAEGIVKKSIIKILNIFPESGVAKTAFR